MEHQKEEQLIKALIRLAFVCLITGAIAKPHPALLNKQEVHAEQTAIPVAKQVEPPHQKEIATAKVETKAATPTPIAAERPPEPKPAPSPPVKVQTALPTNKTELMRLAGIPESDYSHVDYIVSKESSWNHKAINKNSGATGLCQALPASKMASEGSDYLTNPITQLKWCHKYATQRYGSWYSAFAFWKANSWW